MLKIAKFACVSLLLTPTISLAEVHPDVKKALDYQLPALSCTQPELPGAGKDVYDPATGAVNRADVDSYTLGRFERAEKRWKKCVASYKKGLFKDFERLKSSASHGLTQDQANTIMAKMKTIQSAIMSPSGDPRDAPEEAPTK